MHLNRAIHYTEINPVKAGLVREPKDWRWSSAWQQGEFDRQTGCPDVPAA